MRFKGLLMTTIDRHDMWVEWTDEDRPYIGKCPDLIPGVHGDVPLHVYKDLCDVIADVTRDFEARRPHFRSLYQDPCSARPYPRKLVLIQARPA